MATFIVINPDQADPFVQIIDAIRGNKRPVLRAIGALMEAESQRSFDKQRFGTHRWAERYPNSSEPFVNVAAFVSDFASGANKPTGRHIKDRRPALKDSGKMQGSIRSRVIHEDTVAVGTNVPYAPVQQWGGVTVQHITQDMKKRMSKWLVTPAGRPFQKKLSFLTMPNNNTLDTEVVARPFLGVSQRLERQIGKLVENGLPGSRGDTATTLRSARLGRSKGRKRGNS